MRAAQTVLLLVHAALGVVVGCGGPKGEKGVSPGDASVEVDAGEVVEACPDGLIAWPGGGCAPLVDECENPWELPLIGGGCVAIGPRACPKLWDPEADVDCEPGQLMEYDGNACPEGFVLTEDEVACIPFFEESCGEMEIPVLGGGCKKVGPNWYDPEAPNGGLDVPYFDECGPGLLALKGGGCVQVGPRACPKLWDPEADVECEVGDLLPCPEGWSESEDGIYCDPKYGECGPGERALVGGGCERVLPLVGDCPPSTYADVPNEAANVVYVNATSGCAEGCGSMAAPHSSISAALDAAPDGAWVLVAAGNYEEGLLVTRPVHVLGVCAGSVLVSGLVQVAGGDIVPDLQAGICVLDSAGVELTGLTISSPGIGLAVVGAQDVSVHDVEVTGSVARGILVAGTDASASLVRIWMHDTLEDLETQKAGGLWILGGAKVDLHQALLEETTGSAIGAFDDGTFLTVSETVVRGTHPWSDQTGGFGLGVDSGPTVKISECLFESNRDVAVVAWGQATTLDLTNSVVRNTNSRPDVPTGYGMQVSEATVTVSDSLFDGNSATGILANGLWGYLATSGTTVRDTKDVDGQGYGTAIQVQGGSEWSAAGCLVEGSTLLGLAVVGQETKAGVRGILVRDTVAVSDGTEGAGLEVAYSASASLVNCLVEGNFGMGLHAYGAETQVQIASSVFRHTMGSQAVEPNVFVDGASVTGSDSLFEGGRGFGVMLQGEAGAAVFGASVVRNTNPSDEGGVGGAFQVSAGASLDLAGCSLENNVGVGISVAGAGSKVVAGASVVLATASNGPSAPGYGLALQDGAAAELSGSLLSANVGAGAAAGGKGVNLQVIDTVVRDTTSDAQGQFGVALNPIDGASMTVSGSLLTGNRGAAIEAHGAGTSIQVEGSVVEETVPDESGVGGYGLSAALGATATVKGSLFARNKRTGVLVWDSGTSVQLSGSCIRSAVPEDELDGIGAGVFGGGELLLSGCLLDATASAGVVLDGVASKLTASGTVVRGTQPQLDGQHGVGLAVQSGASAFISECAFQGNSGVAGLALGSGTSMALSATIIEDTKDDGNLAGHGLQVSGGAKAGVEGCVLRRNHEAGIMGADAGTTVTVAGSLVSATLSRPDGSRGIGITAQDGAAVSVRSSCANENTTAGVLVTGPGSAAVLEASAVLSTSSGGAEHARSSFQVYGDGLVADDGGELDLVSVLVSGNARNGIYYNQSSGSVTDSVIVGNDFYGLAMEECADQVTWEGLGNHVVGNASALPPDKAAQVTTSTGGMAVPPTPEMIEIPTGPLD